MKIYFDESGNLGFDFSKQGTTRYLVMTMLLVKDSESFNKKVKRKIKKERLKLNIPRGVELKAYSSCSNTKNCILTTISAEEVEIQTIILNKLRVKKELQDNSEILYNFIAGRLLVPSLVEYLLKNNRVELVVDKRHREKVHGLKFSHYIKMKAFEKLIAKGGWGKSQNLEIHHLESQSVYGLMAVDFICNTIFRKYERGKDNQYNIIQREIANEIQYLF